MNLLTCTNQVEREILLMTDRQTDRQFSDTEWLELINHFGTIVDFFLSTIYCSFSVV